MFSLILFKTFLKHTVTVKFSGLNILENIWDSVSTQLNKI